MDLLNFNLLKIPKFTDQEYQILRTWTNDLTPTETISLADRVAQFKTISDDLARETHWNKRMPWVVGTVEVTLIAATVLVGIFATAWVALPLLLCFFFDLGLLYASTQGIHYGTVPPVGAVLYIYSLGTRQSELELEHQYLNQMLPGEIQKARLFWKKYGNIISNNITRYKGMCNGSETLSYPHLLEQIQIGQQLAASLPHEDQSVVAN